MDGSDFGPYPGFEAWPYKEYSEVFFGPDYKVLRGGSFAVSPVACRATFRNWDYPIRRQIFAGFRTARSGRRGARLMCRHLAYLGRPPRCARCSSTRRTACTGRRGHRGGSGTAR